MRRRAAIALGLLLILPLALPSILGACTGEPGLRVSEIAVELLFEEDLRTVLEEPADAPVRVEYLRARRPVGEDIAELPALVLAPGSRVELRVPEDVPAGSLSLAADVGLDASAANMLAHSQAARVTFTVDVDGERVFEGTRMATGGSNLAGAWLPVTDGVGGAIPVRRGSLVTLATSVEAKPPLTGRSAPLPAGFGRLRILRGGAIHPEPPTPEAPSLVLVVMDTLRDDATGLGGCEVDATPRLDAFGATGTVHERAYATSSWTWPSTASILTGRPVNAHGVRDPGTSYLHGEVDTLAELAQRAGMVTAAFIGNRLVSSNYNFDQGFQLFVDPNDNEFVDSRRIVPAALEWLRENKDRRSFLYLHLVDPHMPLDPSRTAEAALPGVPPDDFRLRNLDRAGERALALEAFAAGPDGPRPLLDAHFPPASRAWQRTHYLQAVRTGDEWFGRVLDTLAELGLDDRTVVAFTADHGEEYFDHGMLFHAQSLHSELVEVPLVLAGPGVERGLRSSTPISNRSLFERLGGLAGLDVPRAPWLFSASPGGDVPGAGAPTIILGTERGHWDGSWRTSIRGALRWPWVLHHAPKATVWGTNPRIGPDADGGIGEGDLRLYNLEEDPGEFVDRAAEHPEVVAELLDALRVEAVASTGHLAGTSLGAGQSALEMLEALGYLEDGE